VGFERPVQVSGAVRHRTEHGSRRIDAVASDRRVRSRPVLIGRTSPDQARVFALEPPVLFVVPGVYESSKFHRGHCAEANQIIVPRPTCQQNSARKRLDLGPFSKGGKVKEDRRFESPLRSSNEAVRTDMYSWVPRAPFRQERGRSCSMVEGLENLRGLWTLHGHGGFEKARLHGRHGLPAAMLSHRIEAIAVVALRSSGSGSCCRGTGDDCKTLSLSVKPIH